MKNKIIQTIKTIFASLLLVSCGFESTLQDAVATNTQECPSVTNNYELRTEGVYRTPEGDIFKATVDFEEQYDSFDSYSAKDFAFMAYLMTLATEELEFANQENIKEGLKNVHIIIASSDEMFSLLLYPYDFDKDPEKYTEEGLAYAAYVFSSPNPCWGEIEESNVTIVFRTKYSRDLDVTMHEYSHTVGGFSFSDSDADHDDVRLWDEFSGRYSAQGRAEEIYHEKVVDYN